MKKLFSVIVSWCFALCASAETEFTFTTSADMSQTKDGITMTIEQGSGQQAPTLTTDYETQKPEMRLYVSNTITISGENLTNIQLVCAKSSASNKQYTGLSASVGTLVSGGEAVDKTDWKIDTWTGSATSVVFTLTGAGQRRIQRIVIDGEPVVIGPEEAPLPTEDDLDWTYEYQEPEIVHTPDTQLFKKEYAFIDGNILVHCTKGSIVYASEEEDAYFGCNENQQLTFTATQYIKGIAIKGTVRKNFSATPSRGEISYYIDENEEPTEDPVLVIRNIDALSVTLSCIKNISCYEVRVYFEENPDPVGTEIDVPGETFFLEYDTVSTEYDQEESMTGKHIYSLYIWDKTNENIYLSLDIHTAEQNKFVGTYSFEDGNMTEDSFFQYGEEYEDYSYATEGQMVINKSNGVYTISGYITCTNKNTYNFSYTGDIEGGLDEDSTEGIKILKEVSAPVKMVRDGQIYILRNGRIFTVSGTEIR